MLFTFSLAASQAKIKIERWASVDNVQGLSIFLMLRENIRVTLSLDLMEDQADQDHQDYEEAEDLLETLDTQEDHRDHPE